MVLTNWKFVATARGIGFQPVCEKPAWVWTLDLVVPLGDRDHTQRFDKLEVRRHGPWDRLSACRVKTHSFGPKPPANPGPTSQRLLLSARGCRLSGYPG